MKIRRHHNRSEQERTLRYPDPGTVEDLVVEGLTDHLATMAFSPEYWLQHVAIKLNHIEPILKRSKTHFGRFINRFNGESAEYITIDGMALIQLHEVLGEALPLSLEAKSQYDVDPHDLIDFYIRAKKILPQRTIKIDVMKAASEKLFAYLEEIGVSEIPLNHDYHWVMKHKEAVDPTKEPELRMLGQLTDNYDAMNRLLKDQDYRTTHDFVWLATLLDYIGHNADDTLINTNQPKS